jgi:hypothetical protein
VALLRWAAPTLPEAIGTVGCLLLFIGFCVYKVWASTAPDRARRTLAVQG